MKLNIYYRNELVKMYETMPKKMTFEVICCFARAFMLNAYKVPIAKEKHS